MSSEIIKVDNVGKCYHIYHSPSGRLRQFFEFSEKKYYDEFWALKNIDFSIKKNETLGIIGLNGSGKSTLLQIISGTLMATTGRIKTNGKVAALLELGAGFNSEFSGIDNIYMMASLYGLSNSDVQLKINDIIEFSGIGEKVNEPVKSYSSGMYVRLAFSVIAHVEADVLIIDEALAVGDAVFSQKCMRFLRRFKENGTLIFVSHDTNSVLSLCDRAIWLHKGLVRSDSTAESVVKQYLEFCNQQLIESATDTKMDLPASSSGKGETKIIPAKHETKLDFFENIKHSESFGAGGAIINWVRLINPDKCMSSISGGEIVSMEISVTAREDLFSVIVGFIVKDRLGQSIFGQNTFQAENRINLTQGQTMVAKIKFVMPLLQHGVYSVTSAIATGELDDHIQQCWLHDSAFINVCTVSKRYGIIGLETTGVSTEISNA